MAQHRRSTRTARRVAAVGVTSAALLALAAGTASASDDDRCERADGVVVCLPTDVDLSGMDVDVNILTHEDEGFPPVHLGP